jgi:hypothetical protein
MVSASPLRPARSPGGPSRPPQARRHVAAPAATRVGGSPAFQLHWLAGSPGDAREGPGTAARQGHPARRPAGRLGCGVAQAKTLLPPAQSADWPPQPCCALCATCRPPPMRSSSSLGGWRCGTTPTRGRAALSSFRPSVRLLRCSRTRWHAPTTTRTSARCSMHRYRLGTCGGAEAVAVLCSLGAVSLGWPACWGSYSCGGQCTAPLMIPHLVVTCCPGHPHPSCTLLLSMCAGVSAPLHGASSHSAGAEPAAAPPAPPPCRALACSGGAAATAAAQVPPTHAACEARTACTTRTSAPSAAYPRVNSLANQPGWLVGRLADQPTRQRAAPSPCSVSH